jgi:hypothetical protein
MEKVYFHIKLNIIVILDFHGKMGVVFWFWWFLHGVRSEFTDGRFGNRCGSYLHWS